MSDEFRELVEQHAQVIDHLVAVDLGSVLCPACGATVLAPEVGPLRVLGRLRCGLDGEHSWDIIDTSTWEDQTAPE